MIPEPGSKRVALRRGGWRSALWAAICVGSLAACSSTQVDSPGSDSDGTGGSQANSGGSTKGNGGRQAGGASDPSSGEAGARATGGSTGKGGDASGGTNRGTAGKDGGAGGSGQGGKDKADGGSGGRGGKDKIDGGSGGKGEGGKDKIDGGSGGKGEGGKDHADGGKIEGEGGGGEFKPCPTNGDPCKLMPLGDSITVGMKSTHDGGYRVELFTKAVDATQNITFVGTFTSGPATVAGKPFPKQHEGISGQRIDEIKGRVANSATKTKPNIVLVLAGTNDLYSPLGSGTMTDRLGNLIDEVIQYAPDALVVVGTLPPLTIGNYASAIETYNGSIPGLVQKRVADGKHVSMVDFGKLPTSMLSDGVHPNDQGYKEMGDIWYEAVKDVLPKGP